MRCRFQLFTTLAVEDHENRIKGDAPLQGHFGLQLALPCALRKRAHGKRCCLWSGSLSFSDDVDF